MDKNANHVCVNLRCKVTNVSTGEIPEEENATLVAGDAYFGRVLMDSEVKTKSMNWEWITFNPKT